MDAPPAPATKKQAPRALVEEVVVATSRAIPAMVRPVQRMIRSPHRSAAMPHRVRATSRPATGQEMTMAASRRDRPLSARSAGMRYGRPYW